MRRQGQILAEALKSQFEAAVQSIQTQAQLPFIAAPVPNAFPPQPFSPPQVLLPMGLPNDQLTGVQQRLAEAELDHKIQLVHGTRAEFLQVVGARWFDKLFISRLNKLVQDNTGKLPRPKEDRITAAFEVLRKIT